MGGRPWRVGRAPRCVALRGRGHLPERAPDERAVAEGGAVQPAPNQRQILDEHDLARDLLLGEHLAEELPKLGFELLGAPRSGHRDDVGADEVPASLEVADADHGARRDGVVRAEHVLHLVRPEGSSAARDDVLRPCDVRDEPVVGDRDVSGQVEIAAKRTLRLVGCFPVAGEQRRRMTADREVALDTVRELLTVVVDDGDVVPGERPADGTGLPHVVAPVTDDDARLRLAVAVVDREPPALLEDLGDLRLEDVPGRDEPAESR